MRLKFSVHLLQDVTPENFLAALGGRSDLLKGVGSGKVINRSVIYYFVVSLICKNRLSVITINLCGRRL